MARIRANVGGLPAGTRRHWSAMLAEAALYMRISPRTFEGWISQKRLQNERWTAALRRPDLLPHADPSRT